MSRTASCCRRPFSTCARTGTEGKRGLLSLAFHPQYARNGYFFVYYSDPAGDIVIERMRVAQGQTNLADPDSGVVLLTIPHPGFSNHYGGLLSFGPDGYLYAGTGGGAGDPARNAQDQASLLGKLLRINVDAAASGRTYAIAPDNPWLGQAGRRAEIWAYGLRNPWRYAFDAAAQRLYIADVGQARREEIDIVPACDGGLNYGWNIMEGSAGHDSATCSQAGLTLPAFAYQHGPGDRNGCAITGGYVYRGSALPELAGHYLYSDYCGGWLKSLYYRDGAVTGPVDWPVAAVGNIVSFGRDGRNKLYMLSADGAVYRIARR